MHDDTSPHSELGAPNRRDAFDFGARSCHNPRHHLRKGFFDIISLDPTSFDRKTCPILIVEIGFCRDLGCNDKIAENTTKYSPLIAALRNYVEKVEFVGIPIDHAGTTSAMTLKSPTSTLSTARPFVETSRANSSITDPTTDTNAKTHGTIFLALLNSLTNLAHSRLLDIIRNRKRLVEALPKKNTK